MRRRSRRGQRRRRRWTAAESPLPPPRLLRRCAIEHKQEKPDHEEGVEEEGELFSLVQQPEAVEKAVVVERLFGSKGMGESAQGDDRVHHSVCLSPPRRERKLSGEDQQEDAKRSKSPEKEDVGQDGMDGFWERHREKMAELGERSFAQAAALQTQQNNQLMAMMKQCAEEGRNPVTGLPPPARR